MGKVPVLGSIARAYGFLFGRLIAIIGLSWLPAAFLGLTVAWCVGHFSADVLASMHGSTTSIHAAMVGEASLLVFATLFFGACMIVPLAQEAFGFHDERVAAHLVVSARELRFFFALVRFSVLFLAVGIILSFVAGYALRDNHIHTLTSILPGPKSVSGDIWRGIALVPLLEQATAALSAFVLAVLAIRLGFFLAPIAATEAHAGIDRASRLSSGNFWRLTGIAAAVLVPVNLSAAAVAYALLGDDMAKAFTAMALHGAEPWVVFAGTHAGTLAAILATDMALAAVLLAGASVAAYEALASAGPLPAATQHETSRRPSEQERIAREEPIGVPGMVMAAMPASEQPASAAFCAIGDEPADPDAAMAAPAAPAGEFWTIGGDTAQQNAGMSVAPQPAGEFWVIGGDPAQGNDPMSAAPQSDLPSHPLATFIPVDAIVLGQLASAPPAAVSGTEEHLPSLAQAAVPEAHDVRPEGLPEPAETFEHEPHVEHAEPHRLETVC